MAATISPWLIGMPPSICARYSPSPIVRSALPARQSARRAHAVRIGGKLTGSPRRRSQNHDRPCAARCSRSIQLAGNAPSLVTRAAIGGSRREQRFDRHGRLARARDQVAGCVGAGCGRAPWSSPVGPKAGMNIRTATQSMCSAQGASEERTSCTHSDGKFAGLLLQDIGEFYVNSIGFLTNRAPNIGSAQPTDTAWSCSHAVSPELRPFRAVAPHRAFP